jgi:mRNA-degrading endonuclease RelE of RelBE toxin-antitoxin system
MIQNLITHDFNLINVNWDGLNFRRWAVGAVILWAIYAALLFLPNFGYDISIFSEQPTVYKSILLINAGVSSAASIATIYSYIFNNSNGPRISQAGSGEHAGGGGGGVAGAGGGGGDGGRGGDFVHIEGDVVLGSVPDELEQSGPANGTDEIEETVGGIVKDSIRSVDDDITAEEQGTQKPSEREDEIPSQLSEWDIKISAAVHNDLKQLSTEEQEKIFEKIDSLQTSPLNRAKKTPDGNYMLRAGDWRIIFDPAPSDETITILMITNRNNIYEQ